MCSRTASTPRPENLTARRSAQTALYRLLDALVRLLAPLISFTAEEVWSHMNRPGSVHTAYFPEPSELTAGLNDAARKRTENWGRLIEVRDLVLKSLEAARNEKLIGAPLEARLRLSANGDLFPLLATVRGCIAWAVHRLASGSGPRGFERFGSSGGARLRTEVRALLEVYRRYRRRRPIPYDLRLLRRRRGRDVEWLMSG